MASKGSCKSTIMLAHADSGPIPVGPAGSSREDVEHQCMGAADGKHPKHYCGCDVEWTNQGVITRAPWLGKEPTPETQPFSEDDYGKYGKYVCVGHNRACGNRRSITHDGVWVKYGLMFSSAHRTCV